MVPRRRWPATLSAIALVLAGCAGPAADAPASPPPTNVTAAAAPTSVASPPATPTAVAEPTAASSTRARSRTPSPTNTPSAAPSMPTPQVRRPVIVVDPGHSGRPIRSRTVNGLLDFDYPNEPEMTEVFDVSSCLAEGLRSDGYQVLLTKQRKDSSVSLTARAALANDHRAELAVSVHDDHSQGATFQATYSQLGLERNGRFHPMYRGLGSRRIVFTEPAVARRSARFAEIIARERSRAQGRPVRVAENSFAGRPPLEPGNLALVQLLSRVPWVYNEMGARTGGDIATRTSLDAETAYAKGLLDGIEAAVPLDPGTPNRHVTGRSAIARCLAARRR